MKLMSCPLNGWRNIGEFVYGGEVRPHPSHDAAAADWADWVFMVDNRAGVVREWWMHAPSAYWFIAERDTEKDLILRTYAASEVFTGRVGFDDGDAAT